MSLNQAKLAQVRRMIRATINESPQTLTVAVPPTDPGDGSLSPFATATSATWRGRLSHARKALPGATMSSVGFASDCEMWLLTEAPTVPSLSATFTVLGAKWRVEMVEQYQIFGGTACYQAGLVRT